MHLVYFKDSIYSRYAKKYVDLVAAMSSYKNIWGINTIQIENGLNVNDYPMTTRKDHDTINIICVANETKFHQYSKVIRGLHNYNKSNKIIFKLIFIGEYMKSTVSLVKKLNLSEHVTFKGKLYGFDLLEQYNFADLALGAFSYKNLGEKSSLLKTKEYIALGIPVITGWDELSFNNQLPFIHLQNTQKNYIDFCHIHDFYTGLSNIKNLKEIMRSFAERNYTWSAQLNRIIDQYKLEVQK
jgi:glycosyltransferase involved in cell wall biosynthesis